MMQERIGKMLQENKWATDDAAKEITESLGEIRMYADGALKDIGEGMGAGELVECISNRAGRLAKAQEKLDALRRERRKLEWLLGDDRKE